MIYLDNAASSHPKPMEVLRAVTRQLKENGANPGRSGHDLSVQAAQTVFNTRSTLAKAFGTRAENIIFTKNTTEAINLALKGLLKTGDHVLISDLEHNSVLRPLVALREIGVRFDVVETAHRDEETAERFFAAVRPETKLIFCTHASNVTGQILPIRMLGEFCRARGILFGADCAQTAGIEEIDLQKDPIEFICVPGHKGLLGPQGTGALILSRPLPLNPILHGGTGSDSLLQHQPLDLPEGFESGTLNTPGIAGLGEGVRFAHRHASIIRNHEKNLRSLFLQQIASASEYRVLGQGEDFVGTVALAHVRDHSEQICQWLDSMGICTRGGFHCAALAHKKLNTETLGAIRISFGYRNTEKDVYECVKILKKYQNNRIRS